MTNHSTKKTRKSKFKFKKCDGCNQKRKYLNEFDECEKCERCKRCNNQRRDYLSEFRICDSCCDQLEQETPSGFRPNFNFEECKRCCFKRDYLNEFNECEKCEKCKRCNNQRKDYSNEFQICNACCKQVEQVTPSGFRPNLNFEKCKGCDQIRDYLNEFNECDSCEKCKRCNNQRRDYLGGYQICDLCCEEMEQMTPSGFKPNFKFEKCKRCNYKRKDYLNEFRICNSCCDQMEQVTPSGFRPNFNFEECKSCCFKRDYLNEFNECSSCEKCKRCKIQRRDYSNEFRICNSCCDQMKQTIPNVFKPNFKSEKCKRCYFKRDYLNEFRICNSCCKQMEQVTPSGFRPNFKFERCKGCYYKKDYLNEFDNCNSCEKCKRCEIQRRDYLNEFQICNACCKQMEQVTPSGFRPNFKFERCKGCDQIRDYLNEFNNCNSCEKCKRCNNQRKDYLNEFQICNACCKQMEQVTPSGFSPNFKFEECEKCYHEWDYLNEFQICNSCCKQMEQVTPSGFKPNFKFEECKGCDQRRYYYLNEFNECEKCEKCKRCEIQRRDYLNEFQICNLCCKQMEQMTQSGFKPNFKFEYCRRCFNKEDYLNEFQICSPCHEQMITSGFKPNFKFEECKGCDQRRYYYLNEFNECEECEECKRCKIQKRDYLNESQMCNSCSSGNKVVDNFLVNQVDGIGMEFIPYSRFKNLEFIAEGGFSKIYRAIWIDELIDSWDSEKQKVVVLKELNNSRNINSKELNELKIYHNLVLKTNNGYINKYYGITQEPITQNFMIIMDYYDLGDLTHYIIKDFFNINWSEKLEILNYIISGLTNIHNANIIHKDYHSGNIFITKKIIIQAITGDLGISKSAIIDDNDEIYGIIPYVAPEIFQGQKYIKASDIYSFGMIMWELMTGRRPFWDQNHNTDLIIEICDGLRPPIVSNAPKGYIELMQECWHSDPNKRPIANDMIRKIMTMFKNEFENRNNPTKILRLPEIGPIAKNNPGAIYKSRPLSAMIKSAESTRSLKSQIIISKLDKRKFDENLTDDIIIKKPKQNENNDYLSKELGFDIDINSSKSKSNEYISKELNFEI